MSGKFGDNNRTKVRATTAQASSSPSKTPQCSYLEAPGPTPLFLGNRPNPVCTFASTASITAGSGGEKLGTTRLPSKSGWVDAILVTTALASTLPALPQAAAAALLSSCDSRRVLTRLTVKAVFSIEDRGRRSAGWPSKFHTLPHWPASMRAILSAITRHLLRLDLSSVRSPNNKRSKANKSFHPCSSCGVFW